MPSDWLIVARVGPDEVQDLATIADTSLASLDQPWVVLRDGERLWALDRDELVPLVAARGRAQAGSLLAALRPSCAELLHHRGVPAALVVDRDVWARELDGLSAGLAGGEKLRIIARVAGAPLVVWAHRPYSQLDRASPDAVRIPQPRANPAPVRRDADVMEPAFPEAGLPQPAAQPPAAPAPSAPSPYVAPAPLPDGGEARHGARLDRPGQSYGAEPFDFGYIDIAEEAQADEPSAHPGADVHAAEDVREERYPDAVSGEGPPEHAMPDIAPEEEAAALPHAGPDDTAEGAPAPDENVVDKNMVDEDVEPARWINAAIEDHDAAQPLVVGDTYTLAISIDALQSQSPAAVGGVRASELTRDKDNSLLLTVSLSSNDFTIGEPERRLKIGRNGLSAGKARFDIEPLRPGLGRLTAVLHRDNNFVQQLDISLQVGPGVVEPAAVVSTGRPIAASGHLSPRKLGLSIQPSATGGFDCIVWGATSANVKLPISAGELAAEIDAARAALLRVVTAKRQDGVRPFQAGVGIDPAARDAALAAIALAGYTLYQKLFFHPAADRQCQELGEWLIKEVNEAKEAFTLQILARDFPVPWAMLYLAPEWDAGKIDFERFLGMKLVIEQIPLRNDKFGLDTRIPGDPDGLSVSLNLNTDIDTQMKTNVVAVQEAYWQQAAAACPAIRLRRRTQAAELLAALNDGATDDQIVYFFCHAESIGLQAGGGPGSSNLTMSGNGSLDLANLVVQAPAKHKLGGAPLVFINACESGKLSPLFYNGFVPYFMSKGARGVIGTECKVPAQFAAAWAKRFFDAFLAGGSLGGIVRDLRRSFYEHDGNPLGLLYGVHCSADTQIDPLPMRH
jgi:hypothetical protein